MSVGILKPSKSMSSLVNFQDYNVVKFLLGLTWYHNSSKIVPGDDPNLTYSNANKTLTIAALSSNYSGIYKFNSIYSLSIILIKCAMMRSCPLQDTIQY